MSVIRSNGSLWHSGEHRVPAPAKAPRSDRDRVAAVEMVALHREVGRWKARTAELERRLAVAEAQALGSQLTPHFLCNSLQAVSTLLHRDREGANAMVLALSDLLRLALRETVAAEIPLARELTLLTRYVDVMQFRYDTGIHLSIETDESAQVALVPQLLLQPLVENAIQHGLGDHAGEIRVSAERRGDMLRCVVSDDGTGLGVEPIVERIGLGTTRARLRALYGDRQSLELATSSTGGVSATVTLPYRVRRDLPEMNA